MSYRYILRAQLRIDEDVRSKPYRDTKGKLTIGVGRNLDEVGLRADEIDFLLDNDIDEAERAAVALIPNFDALNDVRKAVVCNMAFNLGQPKLSEFHNTLRAIREQRWGDAADHMLDSKWKTDVGVRALRLARQMRTGEP